MKTCSKCKKTKKLGEFYRKSSSKNDLRAQCKACCQIDNRKHYYSNPEKDKERNKTWHENNREQSRSQKNKWRLANPIKQKEAIARWEKANPDRKRAHAHNRRVRLANNGGGIYTRQDWELILWIYDNRCLMCGATFLPEHLTVDHIISIVNSGTNDPGNLQPLCHSCNSSKGKKTIDLRDVRDRRNIYAY